MEFKWYAEKFIEPRLEACTVSRGQALASGEACLVTRNDPMHDSVAYLRNNLKRETDILHEYLDRKSTRLNSSHIQKSRMPSSA